MKIQDEYINQIKYLNSFFGKENEIKQIYEKNYAIINDICLLQKDFNYQNFKGLVNNFINKFCQYSDFLSIPLEILLNDLRKEINDTNKILNDINEVQAFFDETDSFLGIKKEISIYKNSIFELKNLTDIQQEHITFINKFNKNRLRVYTKTLEDLNYIINFKKTYVASDYIENLTVTVSIKLNKLTLNSSYKDLDEISLFINRIKNNLMIIKKIFVKLQSLKDIISDSKYSSMKKHIDNEIFNVKKYISSMEKNNEYIKSGKYNSLLKTLDNKIGKIKHTLDTNLTYNPFLFSNISFEEYETSEPSDIPMILLFFYMCCVFLMTLLCLVGAPLMIFSSIVNGTNSSVAYYLLTFGNFFVYINWFIFFNEPQLKIVLFRKKIIESNLNLTNDLI